MSEPETKTKTGRAAAATAAAATVAAELDTGDVSAELAAEIAREWRKTGSVRAGFTLRHVTRGGVTGAVVKRAGA
jgi:hypothetical protein